MTNKPQFSIIMPTFERGEIFLKSIAAAIEAIKDLDAEIIVINDSKKNKLTLPLPHSNVTIINNPKNGVASARNLGASLAKSDLLIFIDDDIIINKNVLHSTLLLYHDNHDRCYNPNWLYPPDLLEKISKTKFGRYLIQYGFTSLQGWNKGRPWNPEDPFQTDLVASYFLPIYKENFNKINGYNEDFPHAGAEDHDFATRLKNSGIKAFIAPQLFVLHNESDRVNLDGWLNRKLRSGQTRKKAVELGYTETKISHSPLKSSLLLLLYNIKFLLHFSLKLIPNNKALDPLSFKVINILLAAYLYKGYTSK